jgi:hypothetical protein
VSQMQLHYGGTTAPKGCYLHLSRWETKYVTETQGMLPGDRQARYLKVPEIVVLILSPFVGLVYVLTLPAATVLVGLYFLGQRLFKLVFGHAKQPAVARHKGSVR